jgi:hypothetical protein
MKTAGKYEEDFKEDIKKAIEDRIDGEAEKTEDEKALQ